MLLNRITVECFFNNSIIAKILVGDPMNFAIRQSINIFITGLFILIIMIVF